MAQGVTKVGFFELSRAWPAPTMETLFTSIGAYLFVGEGCIEQAKELAAPCRVE